MSPGPWGWGSKAWRSRLGKAGGILGAVAARDGYRPGETGMCVEKELCGCREEGLEELRGSMDHWTGH